MVNAVSILIADAMVAFLNALTLSHPFTAERKYVPSYALEDLAAIRVPVVPRTLEQEMADRSRVDETYAIDVGILKHLNCSDDQVEAAADPLMLFTQQLAEALRNQRTLSLTGGAVAAWTGLTNDPLYIPEHLTTMRQFTSVLTTTWKVVR